MLIKSVHIESLFVIGSNDDICPAVIIKVANLDVAY